MNAYMGVLRVGGDDGWGGCGGVVQRGTGGIGKERDIVCGPRRLRQVESSNVYLVHHRAYTHKYR